MLVKMGIVMRTVIGLLLGIAFIIAGKLYKKNKKVSKILVVVGMVLIVLSAVMFLLIFILVGNM